MIPGSAREAPAHTGYRLDKFFAQRIGGETSCPLCARQRPPPTGCRAMPAQARGPLDRTSIWGVAVVDGRHCHRLVGSLANTPSFQPPGELAPNVLCQPGTAVRSALRMFYESGTPAPVRHTRPPWLETALFTAMAVNASTS